MSPPASPLAALDFDALVALGRAQLPVLAPAWTDYNYHDPGMTLIDLLAWIADTQIYAVGRNRADERLAMAALLGLQPRRALPATGTLYPIGDVDRSLDYEIPFGTRLTPTIGCAPRLEVAHPISLVPLSLIRLTVEGLPEGTIDLTDANRRAQVGFAPFGVPPTPGAALVAKLTGQLPGRDLLLSIGFDLEGGGSAAARNDELGAISIFYRGRSGLEVPLVSVFDSTVDLQRSGVIVVRLPAGGPHGIAAEHEVVVRADRGNALMPRLLSIAPNALPVGQKASFTGLAFAGTGRPNQRLEIVPATLFEADELAEGRGWRLAEGGVQVSVGQERWTAGELNNAEPSDQFYAAREAGERDAIEIAFGNGVNGACPPPYQAIGVSLELSCGDQGNIASALEWQMAAPRMTWRNRQPIAGGQGTETIDDLLARARRTLRDGRALTASTQIERAARDLPEAFGVSRATIVEGWEPHRRRPASRATRTLLLGRRGEAAENDAWLRAVARRLEPRIPIGERLAVAAFSDRPLRVAARITVVPGALPERVRGALGDRLARCLDRSPGVILPQGMEISASAVAGWMRTVPDVDQVRDVRLLDADGRPGGEMLRLSPGQLPRLITDHLAEDIVIEATKS
jgi:hypothetical protein